MPKPSFPKGIYFQKGMIGREFMAMHLWCSLNNIPFRLISTEDISNLDPNWLPIGNVVFIQHWLGEEVVPDYYPEWAKPILTRKVWLSADIPYKACFVKPNRYKHFTGYVKPKGTIHSVGNLNGFWCSDIVDFVNEWRLLIRDGEVLDKSWYLGEEEDKPCPSLCFDVPKGVYGALDIGELRSGETEIIEFHHPFSIGWYGDNINAYAEFLIEGWKFMSTKSALDKIGQI